MKVQKAIIFSLLNILLTTILSAQVGASLTFTEVMFNTESGTNSEFIEIYNTSSTDSVDLNGYQLTYSTSGADIIEDAGEGTILFPLSYAVVFESDYDILNGIYSSLIPDDALILKITTVSFGSSGMANSSDRPIRLSNQNQDSLDYYIYSANNSSGISDEKIEPTKDNSSVNWGNSQSTNGTPGKKNSIAPLTNDLAIESVTVIPSAIKVDEAFTISILIKNNGLAAAEVFALLLYDDENHNSSPDINEIIYAENYSTLPAGDNLIIDYNYIKSDSGQCGVIALIDYPPDENIFNNTKSVLFDVVIPPCSYNDLMINEFMPTPEDGEPEWIELYNDSIDIINVKGFKLFDASTGVTLTQSDFFVLPESFWVITKDSSVINYYPHPINLLEVNLPALNNSGDKIKLVGPYGTVIDSLIYNSEWEGKSGKSFERILYEGESNNHNNWGVSIDTCGATPGLKNSFSQKNKDLKVSGLFFDKEFGYEDSSVVLRCDIVNIGLRAATDFELEVRCTTTESVHFLMQYNYLNTGDSMSVIVNFTNLEVGEYEFMCIITYYDDEKQDNNKLNCKLKVIPKSYEYNHIVINEIMYKPEDDEPEWVELFNRGLTRVNLNGWTIGDKDRNIILSDSSFYIYPDNYLIVSAIENIENCYDTICCPILKINLPSLNNSGDVILIKDFHGDKVDSVFYQNTWGGNNGHSLERKSVDFQSNDPNNWGTSVFAEKATPGKENSVLIKNFDLGIEGISFYPPEPLSGDLISLNVQVKNCGTVSAAGGILKLFEIKEGSRVEIAEKTLDEIQSFCSSYYLFNDVVWLEEDVVLEAILSWDKDLNNSNNSTTLNLRPSFEKYSLIITEFMNDPLNAAAEWVELFNNSEYSINLKGWKISEALPSVSFSPILSYDLFLSPDEYFIICKDAVTASYLIESGIKHSLVSFGSLGNSEDGIFLVDFRDNVIDSVCYNNSWKIEKGKSVEKINYNNIGSSYDNWAVSISQTGGTPGEQNTVSKITGLQKKSLIINEVLYEPSSDNSEYLEIMNNSDSDIELGGCYLRIGSDLVKLSSSNFSLHPGDYYVIAADSIIFHFYPFLSSAYVTPRLSLNNSGTLISLCDFWSNSIDSIHYSAELHNPNLYSYKNKSLERVNHSLESGDANNWSTSVDPLGGTPGRQNSIHVETIPASAGIDISPNPFSPDNDGFEDFTLINYNLPNVISRIRLRVYDHVGRLVRTIINNQPTGSKGTIVFDGFDDENRPLRIGIYIILFEATDLASGYSEVLKRAIVVARKL